MKVVVDSNIIFSATLSENSKFRKILHNSEHEFVAPYELFEEIYNNLDKIIKYSKSSETETNKFLNQLLSKLSYYHLDLIPHKVYERAYYLCKDYDASDTPFVALAIHLEAKLWTGDKIKNHLIKNGFTDLF
jgi:predicted nucleic acid-binding protein